MKRTFLLLLLSCACAVALAQTAVPPLTGHVTDRTATLTPEQVRSLDEALRSFEARKGSQIAVLVVASTGPESIEQYSIRVADQWKLGRRKVDDGAILVVAKDDRTLRIEVGYGLEGVLTDAACRRIIDERIVPRLRGGDFYGGIAAGIDSMTGLVDGEALPAPPQAAQDSAGGLRHVGPIFFMVAIAIGMVLRSALGRLPGAIVTGGVVGGIAWWLAGALYIAIGAGAMAFVITLLGAAGGMGMMGYGSGAGRGGGFSGGGGGFGGGGASGRW